MSVRNEEGFVLTEALAALVVTAFTAAALVSALHAARGYAAEAAARDAALREARHLLAEAQGPAPRRLRTQGELGRLAWTRTIAPLGDAPEVLRVAVEVRWSIGHKEGATRLVTYRPAPRT